ncbi:MAG: ABC-type transport auxiliary lipoprotein family protein, partial [Nitrospira sp.]
DPMGPVLLVSAAQAEPGFETPRMVYVTKPYELEYFAASQWADSPARLFTASLSRALAAGGLWRATVMLPSTIRGEYRLDTAGVAIRHEFVRRPSQVRLSVRGQLIDLKDNKILGTRIFETVEPASTDDAYGGVVAANRAMAVVLADMTAWVQACVKHAPECHR